jgi:DedD protein
MRGVFDDKEVAPVPARRDTELTLGSGMLLAIFFGLVLLCGLCFGLGYAVGHRGSQPSVVAETQPAAGSSPVGAGSSLAKPSATQLAPQPPPPPSTDAEQPPADPSGATPAASAETLPALVQASTAPGQTQVRPALGSAPAGASGTSAASTNSRLGLAPAAGAPPAGAQPSGTLMVQIAAVSNAEDADVLTGALRKRGYTVTVRRDPADNLIHVRIGPFATAAEAGTWRMKLLNDGYNAIVQP